MPVATTTLQPALSQTPKSIAARSKAKRQRLNPQQLRFVKHYSYDILANGTKAAIAAGYGRASAAAAATQLLKLPKVVEAIAKLQVRQLQKMDVLIAAEIQEISRIAFSDPGDLLGEDGKMLPVADWPDDIRHAIASYECDKSGNVTKIRFWSKPEALEMLAKYTRIFATDTPQAAIQSRETVFRIEFIRPKPAAELESADAMSHPDTEADDFSAQATISGSREGQAQVTIKLLPSAPTKPGGPKPQVIDAQPIPEDGDSNSA